MLNDQTRLTRAAAANTAEVGGDIIFLHEEDGVYYSLSDVGALVWKTLATPRTFGDVVAAVLAEYEVSAAQAREDLEQLLDDLAAKDLVQIDPPADR